MCIHRNGSRFYSFITFKMLLEKGKEKKAITLLPIPSPPSSFSLSSITSTTPTTTTTTPTTTDTTNTNTATTTTTKLYKNIKCTLEKILVNGKQKQKRQQILKAINDRCLSVSKMAVDASHLCRLMVESLLQMEWRTKHKTDDAWPDFTDVNLFVRLFTNNNYYSGETVSKPIPALNLTWKAKPYSQKFHPIAIKRHHFDYNLINYCAKTFQTCFLNNLRVNFNSRQRRAVKTFLDNNNQNNNHHHHHSRSLIYALQCLINGWRYVGKTYSTNQLGELENYYYSTLIRKHREHLPIDRLLEINKNTLQPVDFLRYYYFLKIEYGEKETKLKKFPLVPQNNTKIHYLHFDAVGVKGLCHDVGLIPTTITISNTSATINNNNNNKQKVKMELDDILKVEGWNYIFNLKLIQKIGGEKWIFDRCIATDGVSCSLRYYKEKEKVVDGNDSIMKLKAITNMTNNNNNHHHTSLSEFVTSSTFPSLYKPITVAKLSLSQSQSLSPITIKTLQQQHPLLSPFSSSSSSFLQLNLCEKRIIGIDPGRKNIAFCVELDPKTRKVVKKTKLTFRQYYHDSGIVKTQKHKQLLMEKKCKLTKNKLFFNDQNNHNKKKKNVDAFKKYLEMYNKNNKNIWNNNTKMTKKWRREKLRVYCLKKKVLNNFINKVIGDNNSKPVHIAFGNAKFAPAGKGESYSSPYILLGKLFERRVGSENFTFVDEWNTSKVCHRCFQPLTRVECFRQGRKKNGVDGRGREEREMITDSEKVVILRGLRCCSTARINKNNKKTKITTLQYNNNNNNNNDDDDDDDNFTKLPLCPIGGKFVNRDSNAAINIAQKLLLLTLS